MSRIALIVALPGALAACAAVDRVQRDMTRDWRMFESDVLKKTVAEKPASERTVAARPATPNERAQRSDPAPPPRPPAARLPVPAGAPAAVPTAAPPTAVATQSAGESDERLRLALAKDYAPGSGADDDQTVAAVIRAAADGGDAQAACNLGMRYVNGRGVARDWAQGES